MDLPCPGPLRRDQADPTFRGTRFEFRDLRIVFSRSSDVAWYVRRFYSSLFETKR